MQRILICLGAGLLMAVPTTHAAEPDLKVELHKAQDKIVWEGTSKQIRYVISSPSGIGHARITRLSGTWPRDAVLRFQYEPTRGFTRLESFSLRTDRLEINGFAKPALSKTNSPEEENFEVQMQFWFIGSDGLPKFQHTGGIPAAGTLKITARQEKGAMEIALPAHLLNETRTVTLDWIDAYRN